MFLKKPVFLVTLMSGLFFLAGCSPEMGRLEIRANGEDFVRQGFVTKDGWTIDFDAVNVTLRDVRAYQTDPPFDAASGVDPEGEYVGLAEVTTIDLAAGSAAAAPVLITTVAAPVGHFNAVSWEMVTGGAGYTLQLVGTAVKDGAMIPFEISINESYQYVCGEFVGDERKGFVDPDATGDVELTFHFDHVFGDAQTDLSEPLNAGALGFDPLAALADAGSLTVNQADLQAGLSSADYATLLDTLATLGHVGEGHCFEADNGYTGHNAD